MTASERIAEHLQRGGRHVRMPFDGWVRVNGFDLLPRSRTTVIRFQRPGGPEFIVDANDERLDKLQFAGVA
jgi:hypothetical protein